jgi:hypothetical protein
MGLLSKITRPALQHVLSSGRNLHQNEKGDIPVGMILIIGVVVIPLVIFLIAYKDDIANFLSEETASVIEKDGSSSSEGQSSGF